MRKRVVYQNRGGRRVEAEQIHDHDIVLDGMLVPVGDYIMYHCGSNCVVQTVVKREDFEAEFKKVDKTKLALKRWD